MSAPNQRFEQFKDYQHKNELLASKFWRRANGLDRGANERLLGGYVQRWVYWALWCFPGLWNYFFPIGQELQKKYDLAKLSRQFYDVLVNNNFDHIIELKGRDNFSNLPEELKKLLEVKPLTFPSADIPKEHLNKFLTNKSVKKLAELNFKTSIYYQPHLCERKLLQATVYGKQDEAETILKKSPHLLLKNTATVIDYSGKTITGLTPFQAALCAGDVEMCEMIKPYFEKLDNGLEEMQRQYDEIFPSGIDAHTQTQKQAAYDFDWIYQKIKGAPDDQVKDALKLTGASFTRTDNLKETSTKDLTKQQLNSLTLVESLNRFREEFDLLSKSEKIFNPYYLLKALELYDNKWNEFTNWEQRDVFWRQIIGYCQRNLPACYAQAIAQGIYFIVYLNEPFKRTLNFRVNNNEAFYPIFVRGCSGLGFSRVWACGRMGDGPARRDLGRLCQTKTSGLEHLRISINTQNKVLLNYL